MLFRSGALAQQVLTALQPMGQLISRYTIVDLSGTLRQRQQERLAAFGDTVRWVNELPDSMQGVVLGNEVLDAMPVKLLARVNGEWFERGVVQKQIEIGDQNTFAWQDRPTELRPPVEVLGAHDYLTEIHPQAEAFMRTLAQKLLANPHSKGAVFLIDYGFIEKI